MVRKMEISADIPQRTITIEVSASDEAITFIEEAKTNNGFMIPLSDRPEPFSTFTFHLHASRGFELSFDAKLLQLLEPPGGGQQGAFQLLDWDGAKDQELARKAVAALAGDDSAPEGETRGASPRNPKTPTPIAVRLLEHVPTRELRQMARMGALRENVRSAAFRLYTKRTSRR